MIKTPSSRSSSRKREDTAIDNESFFRNLIDSLFITASWVEAVKAKTGIVGVSQVWSDRPEWYLWVEGSPGPFDLVLQDSETVLLEGRSMALGRFAVKCYPYASDPLFHTFSEAERCCLDSDRFDPTRTPVLEAKTHIAESYFTVGALLIVADAKEALCMFTYDSLDLLRAWELDLPPRGRGSYRISRQVPGWRIGYTLFDRMVGLYAFFTRRPPLRFGAARSPGFESFLDHDGRQQWRGSPDLSALSASLLFSKPTTPANWINALWHSRLEATDEVVFETEFARGPVQPGDIKQPAQFPLNNMWWQLATMTAHSHLSSTCGCGLDCSHGH